MAGHKKEKYPFRSISLGAYEDGPRLVHYGVLTFTENYLKPECEILEYDKARWHIKVQWSHPEETGQEIMVGDGKAEFGNILILMDLG
jgi:hypothetical protein